MAVEAVIFQQIVDINWDQAIYTASPNNTINVAQFAAKGSGTNIGIALTPKGTGYISAQVPDGTTAGGNARGAGAVDFQMTRAVAAGVASGAGSGILCGSGNIAGGVNAGVLSGQQSNASGLRSAIIGGVSNTASGTNATAGGSTCVASGADSIAIGTSSTASGSTSIALGSNVVSSAESSIALGNFSRAHRPGMLAFTATGFASAGDGQTFGQTLGIKTTDATETELRPRGALTGDRMTLLANTLIHATIHISGVKSDGSACAAYLRKVVIKRVVNTTTLENLQTLGTDVTGGTSIAITADDTNDSLKVAVTGIAAETWRWIASVSGIELGIGT